MQERLKQIKDHYPELDIQEINHDIDHIHILTVIPPKMSVSTAVRIIKSNTSKDLKRKFSFLKDVYWGTDGIWSDGYFVSTVGVNEEVIKKYIEQQGKEYRATGERRFGASAACTRLKADLIPWV